MYQPFQTDFIGAKQRWKTQTSIYWFIERRWDRTHLRPCVHRNTTERAKPHYETTWNNDRYTNEMKTKISFIKRNIENILFQWTHFCEQVSSVNDAAMMLLWNLAKGKGDRRIISQSIRNTLRWAVTTALYAKRYSPVCRQRWRKDRISKRCLTGFINTTHLKCFRSKRRNRWNDREPWTGCWRKASLDRKDSKGLLGWWGSTGNAEISDSVPAMPPLTPTLSTTTANPLNSEWQWVLRT